MNFIHNEQRAVVKLPFSLGEKKAVDMVGPRWVPRMLYDQKKETRLDICRSLLTRHTADPAGYMDRVITIDESWISFFILETESNSNNGNTETHSLRKNSDKPSRMV